MDPFMALLLGAGNNPGLYGPLLDSLGPQFGPGNMLPTLQTVALGGNPGMFGTPDPSAVAAPTDPNLAGTVPALSTTTPPNPMMGGMGGMPRMMAPAVSRPEAPKPVFSGGVAGAQKAPEFGGAGGNLIQMLLQAAMQGKQQTPPSLGALLGGAR